MFGFSVLIFYGVFALMNISSAQDPPWNCSFGSFDPPVKEQDEPCSICLAERKSEPFFWFVTDKVRSFGEKQPYFRAALNNPNNSEGVSAECTLLNASLPRSNGGLLSFRYIFNSESRNERHGYFNYSVCKDEGTVHQLHVVEGWALKKHSFNCTDIQISFKAVRGDDNTNVGIDDVNVVQPEVSLQSTSSSDNIQTLSATNPTTEVLSTMGETKPQTVQVVEQTGSTSHQGEPIPRYILYVASSVAVTCLLLAVIIAIFFRRKCRSRSKPVSSQGSDVDDTGLVINELYDEWSALPSASDILVDGDHAPSSSTTTPDTIGTNADTDMGNIAGDEHGGWACRSAHYKTTCDDITYHTLEAPTKDDCTIYQGQENTYADIEDKRFGVSNVGDDLKDTKGDGNCNLACRSTQEKTSCDGNTYYTLEVPTNDISADIEKDRNDKAWRSMSNKTTCHPNTYYTLEIPSKDDERHGEVSDNEYEDVGKVNFTGQEDAGVNKRFTLERRSLGPDAGTSSNKQHQNGNTDIRLSKGEEYDILNFRTSVKKSSRHTVNGAFAEETENKDMYGSLNLPETSDPPNSLDIQLINDNVYGNLSDVDVDPGKCQGEKPIASWVEPEATYQNMKL